MRRRLVAFCLALALVSLLPPAAAMAAEYQMATVADYVVDPVAGEIAVTVGVTFTNTTPNPPGKLSGFDRIDLAVHGGASQVEASDARGPLTVELLTRDGVQIASVTARARVRYNRSATFTLTYRLADGAAPGVHVRPEVVKFAAFGFGTTSDVTVELPAGYEARADGDPMVASEGAGLRLTSGPIPDPDRWLSLVTASRPSTFATQSASVALETGTVDLQVRAWSGDPAWGRRTLDMLVTGLPLLEQAIGLPYPRVGPLVVTEAIGGEGSATATPPAASEVQVAFDGDDFTLLHQAAHLWIDPQLASDRWIREGLASHYAEQAARELGLTLPYDPAVRAEELAADARPLATWGVGATGTEGDASAYAASWAFVDRIATAAGERHLQEAMRRVVAGLSAYDPIDPEGAAPTAAGFLPVDSRRLLDQLEAVSGVHLADLFEVTVLGPDADLELIQRTSARADYGRLMIASGDWGAPEAVRTEMAAWRFDRAREAIGEAAAWLTQRDQLVADIAAGGLTTPDHLRQAYASAGGGPDAQSELDAEQAVVASYLELRARATAARGPLEAVGLFAMDDPRVLLAGAATKFGAGDLGAAVDALDGVELELNQAPTTGLVRLASAIVLLGAIGLLASRAARGRGGSHYTAGP